MAKITKFFLAVVTALFAMLSTGFADINIIYGTGLGKDPINNGTQRDDHWDIVAVAKDFAIPGGQSTPYDAYVPYSISWNWLGGGGPVWGANNGYVVDGITYYWVGPNTSSQFAPFPETWSFVLAQTFTITDAGLYEFNFYGSGDNWLYFYVDGSVTGTGTNNPTITGGTPILANGEGFNQLAVYNGTVYLSAGVHTAYAVVVDGGFEAGALISNSTFAPAIPEPSAVLLLVIGIGFLMLRRRIMGRAAH